MTDTIPGTQTLFRGLAVIEAVAAGVQELTTLAHTLALSRSTTQRLAGALVKARNLRVEYDRTTLGAKEKEHGSHPREQIPLTALARPVLEALVAQTQDTVHLGVPESTDVLYLDRISGERGLQMRSRTGHPMPVALTGVGKTMMLDMQEHRWMELHRAGLASVNSRGTPRPWDTYRQEMRDYVRQSMAALDFAENDVGIHCVAAPIRDAGDRIVAALSVTSAAQHMPRTHMRTLIPEVSMAAKAVSRNLGWEPLAAVVPRDRRTGRSSHAD